MKLNGIYTGKIVEWNRGIWSEFGQYNLGERTYDYWDLKEPNRVSTVLASTITENIRTRQWVLKKKEKSVTEQPKARFHSYMNEMTVEAEKTFFRGKEEYVHGKDGKGRPFTVPKAWMQKAAPVEPPVGTIVEVTDNQGKYPIHYKRFTNGWAAFGSKTQFAWNEIIYSGSKFRVVQAAK